MARSNQAKWAMNEIFLILGNFMDPENSDEKTVSIFKKLTGWVVFGKDRTMLPLYLEASSRRLVTLDKPYQKEAAKILLNCIKNFKQEKEYPDLLYLAKDLYSDDLEGGESEQ